MLEQIKQAIKEFEAVQDKYSEFGACDTEPNSVFKYLMCEVAKGRTVHIPITGDAWQLYSSTFDCTAAAQSLYNAAKKAVDLIEYCPLNQSKDVRTFIHRYYGAI